MRKYAFLLAVVLLAACPGGKMAEEINLSQPARGEKTLDECLGERRSIRDFKEDTLTTEQLSTLLWAAQGITDSSRGFRTAPSAGATYPLETYLLLNSGVYLYHPQSHKLTLITRGDKRSELSAACLGQQWVEDAPAVVVFCAVPERTSQRYGERTMRYVWMEAGHAAQNLLLEAVNLGLGGVPVGAFRDDAVADVLRLADRERKTIPLYVIPVGVPG